MALSLETSIQYSTKRKKIGRKKIFSLDNALFLIQIGIPIIIIFAIYALTAFVNSRIQLINKNIETKKVEIQNLEREIENFKNKIESEKSKNLHIRIEKFQLGLRSPKWKQLRDLNLQTTIEPKEKKNIAQLQKNKSTAKSSN